MSDRHRLFRRGFELAPPAQPADQAARGRPRPAGGVPAAAGRPAVLAVVAARRRPGRPACCGRSLRAMRIPARPADLDRRRQRAVLPGRDRQAASRSGRSSVTREGLTFGLISAGRILVAFLASVTFLFTTLADDLLEALVEPRGQPPDRVRRAVGGPDGAADAGAGRARSSRRSRRAGCRSTGSFGQRIRALVPLIGPVLLGSLVDVRERTFALEARGFGARPGGPPTGSWPTRRSTAGCG